MLEELCSSGGIYGGHGHGMFRARTLLQTTLGTGNHARYQGGEEYCVIGLIAASLPWQRTPRTSPLGFVTIELLWCYGRLIISVCDL